MEHRHKVRKNLFLYLEVIDRDTQQLIGHLGDISQDGLMIICEYILPLRLRKNLRIKLPNSEDFTQQYLDVEVETRWTALDVNPDLHCIGCLFLHVDDADKTVIKQVGDVLSFSG